jgi:hypothetical protein
MAGGMGVFELNRRFDDLRSGSCKYRLGNDGYWGRGCSVEPINKFNMTNGQFLFTCFITSMNLSGFYRSFDVSSQKIGGNKTIFCQKHYIFWVYLELLR